MSQYYLIHAPLYVVPPACEKGTQQASDAGQAQCPLWVKSGQTIPAQNSALSCPLWVTSGHDDKAGQCPLYPQKRTFIGRCRMSALCQ
jgi:hypothetical protein